MKQSQYETGQPLILYTYLGELYSVTVLFVVLDENCACGGRFTDHAKLDDSLCEDGTTPPSSEIAYRPVYQAWSKSTPLTLKLYSATIW